jgi:hypothetical protein
MYQSKRGIMGSVCNVTLHYGSAKFGGTDWKLGDEAQFTIDATLFIS